MLLSKSKKSGMKYRTQNFFATGLLLWTAGFAAVFLLLIYFAKLGRASIELNPSQFSWTGTDKWILKNLSLDPGVWGQFGDFVGGILNPAIGLVTIYLVLVNVRLQRRELKATVREMRASNAALENQSKLQERQNIEQTFFTWISTYREAVSSARFSHTMVGNSEGRDALHSAQQYFLSGDELARRMVASGIPTGETYRRMVNEALLDVEFLPNFMDASRIQWKKTNDSISHHVEPIVRTLSELMKWVHQLPPALISLNKKRQYFDIISAQISDIERTFLFLYCFFSKDQRLARLINKYGVFHYLILDSDFLLKILSKHPDSPFEPSAFNKE